MWRIRCRTGRICELMEEKKRKMIRISQIKVPLEHTQEDVLRKAAALLRIAPSAILSWQIVKKSIDARKKPEIWIIYSLDVAVASPKKVLAGCRSRQVQAVEEKAYRFPASADRMQSGCSRPVIIGTGPAGLFCGYLLAKHGYRPLLLERGRPVEQRQADVEKFWREGVLDPASNVQFGEGGAGTFSDGKLNTLVKDKDGRNREVLRIFVENGAPEQILYEAKPHIGTDILISVVRSMRERIRSWGGEVRFGAQVTDLLCRGQQVTGVVVSCQERQETGVAGSYQEEQKTDLAGSCQEKQEPGSDCIQACHKEIIESEIVVLAVGHSARDTFEMLYHRQVPMEAKSFAVGLRMEHPRRMIDRMQYADADNPLLPAASYKVTAQTSFGRGVYSFCMCPGGYVVNASSEPGRLCVNGMSYSGRDGANSNSAMIVTVTPEDYPDPTPLGGIAFQRELEERAYRIGKGAVPVETYGAFRQAVKAFTEPDESAVRQYDPGFAPAIKGNYRMAPVHDILPPELGCALAEGIDLIGQTVHGFSDSGAYLSGVESRTSSPVRIMRDETGQSAFRGLYPCGEGAGYAGGITSAAMDGMMIAEKIAVRLLDNRGGRYAGDNTV